MGRLQLTSAALILMLAATSVHSLSLPSISRNGSIDSAYVDPANPTTATSVTLHVSVEGHLALDRFVVQQVGKMFTVQVYWKSPASGSTGAGPSSAETALGTLSKGTYLVLVQSYCDNRFADIAQVAFGVEAADGTSEPDGTIDEVWVTPESLTASEVATIHVEGHWPSAGYKLQLATTQINGQTITVNLHWNSPKGAAAAVVTPYECKKSVRLLNPGTYTVRVRVFLDKNLTDSAEVTLEVAPGDFDWPWDFGL